MCKEYHQVILSLAQVHGAKIVKQSEALSLFWEILAHADDKEFVKELHDRETYKFFSWAFTNESEDKQVFNISSVDANVINVILSAVKNLEGKTFSVTGGGCFIIVSSWPVEDIHYIPLHTTLATESGIHIKHHFRKKNKLINISLFANENKELFIERIRKKLINKTAAYFDYPSDKLKVDIPWFDYRRMKKVPFKSGNIFVCDCSLKLVGSPECIAMALYAGLGDSTAMGFGHMYRVG